MIKLLRNTGAALLLSGVMIANTVPSYSVDNGFISNIKELKELSDIMNIIKENHVGDVLLVEKGFYETREKAKRAIMAGLVIINEKKIDKP